MIVGCERCSTQFQLDDARIPADGVKVRCSRCKHAFVVHPEGADDVAQEAIHAIAQRAAESGGIPDVTEDAAPVEAAPAAAEPSDPTLEDEEAAWEFGDGFDELGSEPEDSSDEVAETSETEAPDSGLELARESSGDLMADSDLDAETDPGVDFSLELEAPEASEASEAAEPPADEGSAVATALFEEPGSEASAEISEAQDGSPAQAAEGDELGSPMEWDLFDDDEPSSAAAAPPVAVAAGSVEAPAPAALDARRKPEPIENVAELDFKQLKLRRVGVACGWLATAGLCVVGLISGLSAAPAALEPQQDIGFGWEIEQVSGRWVDTLSAGPVFAVSGRVRNGAPSSHALPELEVVWRDRDGRALGPPTPLVAPRGPIALREEALTVLDGPSELTGAMLRPGSGLDFEAVAPGLPYEADHFEVRVAGVEAG